MMKKLFFWLVFLSVGMQAQIINFPDANFKEKLLAKTDSSGNPMNIDVNNNGEIEVSEAELINRLNISSDFYSSNKITSLEGILAFKNLESLDCSGNKLTTLDLRSLEKLKNINCSENDLKSLDLQNLKNLTSLICYDYNGTIYLNSLNVKGCENLVQLICYTNGNTDWIPISFQGCLKLQTLHCSGNSIDNSNVKDIPNISSLSYNGSNSLDLSGFTKLSYISCWGDVVDLNLENCNELNSIKITGNYKMNNLNIKGCSNLQSLVLEGVKIPEVNLNEFKKLANLNIQNSGINSLIAENLPQLTNVFLNSNIKLSLLSFQGCTGLTGLELNPWYYDNAYYTDLSTLNLKGCTNLNYLKSNYSKLTNLDLSGLINLTVLKCTGNQLTNLDLSGLSKLQTIECNDNKLTNLNFTGLSVIKNVNCRDNPLVKVDAPDLKIEDVLDFSNTEVSFVKLHSCNSIIASGLRSSALKIICPAGSMAINGSQSLETIDLNDSKMGIELIADLPLLKNLYMKNGIADQIYDGFSDLPNLKYVCTDETEVEYLKAKLAQGGVSTANINSYCSFTPGGNHNTISGTVRFDANSNGCDASDSAFEFLKLKIDDGTNSGETFTQNDGKYAFYMQTGNFNIIAQAENPNLFSISPANFNTSFADSNNNVITQDICVTANGNQNDAEVVIAPLTNARPGFDAVYNLVWRNKGNTVLSGKVVLNYDANKMTFQNSSLPYSVISNGSIEFDYNDLKPFENTASEITFTINTPTNSTNPVNSGDVLAFNAQVTPSNTDITPEDNNFGFNQTVVNSFDPNNIVCLEGETVPVTSVGKYFHYVINFENTGTAEAENIVVKMNVDPTEFDINTLQLQNASADVQTNIVGNQVEFMFKKIKLATGGHGNVLLKMRSKSDLAEGDTVNNVADIYFDYNFPIVTNDYVTTIYNASTILAAKFNYIASDFSNNNYPVEFDATLSTGTITNYQWEFSGNPSISSSSAVKPTVTYTVPGNYTAKLIVSDAENNTSTKTVNFIIGGNTADLSTGKNSENNFIAIDSDDDDWKGYDINGTEITPKVRQTFTGWSHADIGNGTNSQWVTLNNFEGYYTYKSREFTIPDNATDAKLNLRSLSFVRNWTYLVKVNPDGSEDEVEITKTQWMNDGFKGWVNSRSPKVDNYALSSGTYYIKVLVYSNNSTVRESLDVNAIVSSSAGLMYANKMMVKAPTLDSDISKENALQIYPIPTKREVNISAQENIRSIELYDSSGRILQKQILSLPSKSTKFDINGSRGIYYLKITTNERVVTQKVIKE